LTVSGAGVPLLLLLLPPLPLLLLAPNFGSFDLG
jgi:hypothetical protein